MIYTVKDIEEPDFGCEGLMDGQQVMHNWTKVFAGHTQDPPVSLEKVYKKSVCFALGSAKRPSLNCEIHTK